MKSGQRFVYLLFILLLTACQGSFEAVQSQAESTGGNHQSCKANSKNTIIGGVDSNESPSWIVNFQGCGGTLVSSQWILTAAHCFEKLKDVETIRIGGLGFSEGVEAEAAELIRHENFGTNEEGKDWDIALVKLKKPVTNQPIRLPDSVMIDSMKTRLEEGIKLIGWGITEVNADAEAGPPTTLQSAEAQFFSSDVCDPVAKKFEIEKTPADQICLGHKDKNQGTCFGDSGGPAYKNIDGKDHLLGITSWGNETCDPSEPAFYTSVAHHLDWIQEKTGMTFSNGQLNCP